MEEKKQDSMPNLQVDIDDDLQKINAECARVLNIFKPVLDYVVWQTVTNDRELFLKGVSGAIEKMQIMVLAQIFAKKLATDEEFKLEQVEKVVEIMAKQMLESLAIMIPVMCDTMKGKNEPAPKDLS